MRGGGSAARYAVIMALARIRNFSIIAHIDHGKSTLADRILQITETVSDREMRDQVLDSMELERERGITIKAQAVRVMFRAADDRVYEMNLIDTPGHVDFTYEVSRSLAACEGAVLVVDAAQGLEAQTLANAYLAIENDLDIVPVVNKIDLPAADPEGVSVEVSDLVGGAPDQVLRISAKTGDGVAEVLQSVVDNVSPPVGEPDAPPRALIFDSSYDQYRGVVAFVRMVDGSFHTHDKVRAMAQGTRFEVEELGFFSPGRRPAKHLSAGEVGYVITGLKDVSQLRVGDTVTLAKHGAAEPLPGYKDVKPMVFAGLFPTDSDQYPELRDALEKLKLNDAALSYEPESSQALGFGFRCGFLGLLHMDIVRERLEREYDLDLLVTAPNVAYRVQTLDGQTIEVHNPAQMPPAGEILSTEEPYVRASIIVPKEFVGTTMELNQDRRGTFGHDGVPVRAPRAAGLRAAAGRDRPRLLRPAEVADARVRLVRLRRDRLPRGGAGQGRRAPGRRAGGLAVHHHPPRQRLRPGQGAGRGAEGADPHSRCSRSPSRRRSGRG